MFSQKKKKKIGNAYICVKSDKTKAMVNAQLFRVGEA